MKTLRSLVRIYVLSAIGISIVARILHSEAGIAARYIDDVTKPAVLLFLVTVPAILCYAATIILASTDVRTVLHMCWHLVATSAIAGGILVSHPALRPRGYWDWSEFFSGSVVIGVATSVTTFLSHFAGRLTLWVVRLMRSRV